jgi:hypothetical protein
MSRFKELRRIQAALENSNRAELAWAAAYCAMRLSIATRKDHQKYWRNLQLKVAQHLSELSSQE